MSVTKKDVDTFGYNFACNTERWVQLNIDKDFNLTMIKFDWNPRRRSSRGGMYATGPGINLAMTDTYLKTGNGTVKFKEYASYEHNKVIGSIYSKDPMDKLKATILHEIAHAIQYYSYTKTETRCRPHGPLFKKYYRMLRINLLNENLPEQEPLKKDFEEYLAKLKAKSRISW